MSTKPTSIAALLALCAAGCGPGAPVEPAQADSAVQVVNGLLPMNSGTIVYDNNQGVFWLADGDLARNQHFGIDDGSIDDSGAMNYQTAKNWVAAMRTWNGGSGYKGHTTWQLPTTPETPTLDHTCVGGATGRCGNSYTFGCVHNALGNLYTYGLATSYPDSVDGAINYTISSIDHNGYKVLLNNLQPSLYWTSALSTGPGGGHQTWSFSNGGPAANTDDNSFFVLPYAPGWYDEVCSVPADNTGVYEYCDGRPLIYDSATQMTWPGDANLARSVSYVGLTVDADGSMSFDNAQQVHGRHAVQLRHGGRLHRHRSRRHRHHRRQEALRAALFPADHAALHLHHAARLLQRGARHVGRHAVQHLTR